MVQGPTPRSLQPNTPVAAKPSPQGVNQAAQTPPPPSTNQSAPVQDSVQAKKLATADLPKDASNSIQDAKFKSGLKDTFKDKAPENIDELKDKILEQAAKTYGGPESEEFKKIFEKLFMDPDKKLDKLLEDALDEYKKKSKNPAEAENALKHLCEFLCRGTRGIANGDDDPGC